MVATEVRNLAQRSATAAKEIKDLINDSVEKVQAGSALVNDSGAKLEEIVTGVRKVRDIVAEIASASSEQAMGVDQVGQAITSMDELTQQNAALAEEASAASKNMSDLARTMNEQFKFFNTEGSHHRKTSKLDFPLAKNKHQAWKLRLRHFLDGSEELTAAHAVSHRDCDLGKWLYSDGMALYGDMMEMHEMKVVHKQMHGYIHDLIDAKTKGDGARAESLYNQVAQCSDAVVGYLDKLERKIS